MWGRRFIALTLFLAVFGWAGYSSGIASAVQVPDFVREIEYRVVAQLHEGRLKSALNASARMAESTNRRGRDAASAALARAIIHSRAQALKGRTYPLSDEQKELLDPYFPSDVLETARWTLPRRRMALGDVLAGWYLREGGVTLGNVIVFSSPRSARNLRLIAHELAHVVQYEQLGIRDFARLYVSNWPLLEGQARDYAARVAEDLRERRT